jgi:antirestriction protein ArdC
MKGKKMKLSSITTKYTLPIGQQIVEGLEKGGLKWFKPFLENSLSNAPKNAISGYEYNGKQLMLLLSPKRKKIVFLFFIGLK